MNAPNLHLGPSDPQDRMRLFESLLKRDVEVRCDFAKMEKGLLERVQKAEAFGPLAALKIEHAAPAGFFDKVEADFMARIHNHREYEQPVNDVIASPLKPSEMELRRIESRLEENLHKVAALESWECRLKADVVLPMGRWEALEESLFTRIERHRKLEQVAPAATWLSLGFFLRLPAARIAAGLVIVAAGLLGARQWLKAPAAPMDTLVYQAQGAAAAELAATFPQGRPDVHGTGDIQSRDDGAMTLVNQRGFVEMRNGSRLKIEEADKRKLRYRVAFAGHGHTARGNVTFFVNKRKGKERYQVSTPDYRIDVVGTYFRVRPDLGGRITTSVMEGKVKIHSEAYGDFEVAAGQSLVYDAVYERYRVLDGGASVKREDIEMPPGLEELGHYGVLTVVSDFAGSEVRIDDRYKGATPLVVLLPPGRHTVQVSREGLPAHDTTVTIAGGGSHRLSLSLPEPVPAASVAVRPKAEKPKSEKVPASAGMPSLPISRDQESDLVYRMAEQSQDWQSAILLYRQVLENPSSPPLRKEASFFSIARLRAEHEKEKTGAKEDFLRYLALYPDGAFSGESWLRLAELEVGRNQDKAIEYYMRSMERLPHHPRLSEMQHRVGLLYLQNRRYDSAVAMFRQSLGNILYANESEKKRIYQSLYRALVAKGDLKGAGQIAEEYRPQDERPSR